jgi:hypothetical protein
MGFPCLPKHEPPFAGLGGPWVPLHHPQMVLRKYTRWPRKPPGTADPEKTAARHQGMNMDGCPHTPPFLVTGGCYYVLWTLHNMFRSFNFWNSNFDFGGKPYIYKQHYEVSYTINSNFLVDKSKNRQAEAPRVLVNRGQNVPHCSMKAPNKTTHLRHHYSWEIYIS